jgi:hypothetical protein
MSDEITNTSDQDQAQEEPVLSLIQAIKDGKRDPKTLDKEMRQRCVEVFLGEAYNIPQMAQLLKRHEKTIKRDIDEIRERNSLAPDLELAKRIISEFVWYSHIHRNHLMRLARDKNASVSEKAQAEYYAHLVGADLITKLQSLGYLPQAPKSIVGEIFHFEGADAPDEIGELEEQIREIKKNGEITGARNLDLQKDLTIIEGSVEALKNASTVNSQQGVISDEAEKQ